MGGECLTGTELHSGKVEKIPEMRVVMVAQH